ncbi:hypothetical protein EV182_005506, partial [Spiromyces aspiralis]
AVGRRNAGDLSPEPRQTHGRRPAPGQRQGINAIPRGYVSLRYGGPVRDVQVTSVR